MDGGNNFDTQADLSASMIATSDYDGAIRVYMRQTAYDEIVEANKIDLGGLEVLENLQQGPIEGQVGGGLGMGMEEAF